MSDLSGTQLGRYRLERVIGAGGFATVYRAHDEVLDAQVAIKVLADNHSLDVDLRARFLDEGRLLRRVKHPALLTVHDVGETNDHRPYLVLELAEGGTLHERLAHTEPTRADLVDLADTLHDTLNELHQAGIVHRDLSPRNIFIHRHGDPAGDASGTPGGGSERGLLKPGERFAVGDLGLAKDLLRTSGVTAGMGTGEFAAPEQKVSGGVVSTRADIFGASALLGFVASKSPTLGPLVEEATRTSRAVDPEARPATITEWRHGLELLDRTDATATSEGAATDGTASRFTAGGERPNRASAALLAFVAISAVVGAAALAIWRPWLGDDTGEQAGTAGQATASDDSTGFGAVFGPDGLSAGWTDDSWSVVEPFSSTDGAVSLQAFGALSFRHRNAIDGDHWVRFTIEADGTTSDLALRGNGTEAEALGECPLPDGTGSDRRSLAISLAELGVTDGLTRISFIAGESPAAFRLSALSIEQAQPPGLDAIDCRR